MRLFDIEGTFGDDYLYFYAPMLDEERSRADMERIVDLLGLEPGERVLDVPCGHGRISNLLAAGGMSVTGVDAVADFIANARRGAELLEVDVEYIVGEMEQLPVEGPFDAIVCWFTSFGYFDDAGNRAVLEQFARVLRPGGRLGIEMLHHDGFVRRFTPAPFSSTVFRGEDVMIDTSRFDPISGRAITERVVHRDGDFRRTVHSVRLPTIPELDSWLEEAGFGERRFYGVGGESPTIDDFRIAVVGVNGRPTSGPASPP
jgi:SAM-dependent methyltransferase